MQIRGFYYHPLPLTAIFAALCAFILVFLTIQVIRLRYKHKQSIGVIKSMEYDRKNGALTNFANTTPMVLILFAAAEVGKANCGVLFFIAGMYLLARIVHIYSLYKFEVRTGSFRLRMFAMITSFSAILVLAGINLYVAAEYISR